jgi:two-component system, NarL family, response regulator NreC
MEQLRLVLADSHNLMRQGLRALLETFPEFTIVGEVANGVAAVDLIECETPDVALIDFNLPDLNGLDVITQVKNRAIKTSIIIFSIHDDVVYARRALERGARSYLLKDSELEEIVYAIHRVAEGKLYLNPLFSNSVLDAMLHPNDYLASQDGLTIRERQVLQMISDGVTNARIAALLVISKRTVETHRANVMRKLNVKSQAELVRVAIQQGLVSSAYGQTQGEQERNRKNDPSHCQHPEL